MNRRELLVGSVTVAVAAVIPALSVAAEQIGYAVGGADGINWQRLRGLTIIKPSTAPGLCMYLSDENDKISYYETDSDDWMSANWKRIRPEIIT